MKTTTSPLKSMLLILTFGWVTAHAQTGFVFTNPTLISGTPKLTGAVYKYANVSANTDALVTIVGFTNGMTLKTFDTTLTHPDAFQPVLYCPISQKAYAEFRVDFVESSNNSLAKVVTEIPMTGIDIDGFTFGTGKIQEFNQFKCSSNYYINFNMAGSDLDIALNGGWYEAMNKSASLVTGIDTTKRHVMFSMVTANVSSVTLRIGTDNKSTTLDTRQSSIYFQKFAFTNIVLPTPKLTNFSGTGVQSKISLSWNLSSSEGLKNIIIERSYTGNGFQAVGDIHITEANKTSYTYEDIRTTGEVVYYRLKLIEEENKFTYSKVLAFQMTKDVQVPEFTAFPSAFKNDLTIRVKAEKTSIGVFQVVNYAGAIVYRQVLNLNEGQNSILISPPDRIPAGVYIATIESGNSRASQKIAKL
jgi:hypothetical protein